MTLPAPRHRHCLQGTHSSTERSRHHACAVSGGTGTELLGPPRSSGSGAQPPMQVASPTCACASRGAEPRCACCGAQPTDFVAKVEGDGVRKALNALLHLYRGAEEQIGKRLL